MNANAMRVPFFNLQFLLVYQFEDSSLQGLNLTNLCAGFVELLHWFTRYKRLLKTDLWQQEAEEGEKEEEEVQNGTSHQITQRSEIRLQSLCERVACTRLNLFQ